MYLYIVGIDIGGTKTAVLLAANGPGIGPDDRIIDRLEFPTPVGNSASQAVPHIIQSIHQILAHHHVSNSSIVIGVSCGGPINSQKGLILSPPNLYGWDHVPIADLLEKEFSAPDRLQNDADACVLAEWQFGAGQGCDSMIFLTMGTGMGAGLILNRRLYTGANGMAGEVGHIRLSECGPVGYGKEGSFEGFCSGGGIAQVARTKAISLLQMGQPASYCPVLSSLDLISAKIVAQKAKEGHPDALDVYRTVGRKLGQGISLLIDILNPQRIVIESIFHRSARLLKDAMMDVVVKETLLPNWKNCQIVPAQLRERIGDFGAISVALYSPEL